MESGAETEERRARFAREKGGGMAGMRLTTDRLTLRHFTEQDMAALHLLLQDEAVNTFLPWFPMKNIEQTRAFYRARMAGKRYCFAVCFQGAPVGYIQADEAGCHDLGYALRREFWHRGFATEAGRALVGLLKAGGVPYITATHDRNNPASGRVMRRLGMRYCYSYEEQWQPKNIPVVFRMYQLNLDGQAGLAFGPDMKVVCEDFRVVWPLDAAVRKEASV